MVQEGGERVSPAGVTARTGSVTQQPPPHDGDPPLPLLISALFSRVLYVACVEVLQALYAVRSAVRGDGGLPVPQV